MSESELDPKQDESELEALPRDGQPLVSHPELEDQLEEIDSNGNDVAESDEESVTELASTSQPGDEADVNEPATGSEYEADDDSYEDDDDELEDEEGEYEEDEYEVGAEDDDEDDDEWEDEADELAEEEHDEAESPVAAEDEQDDETDDELSAEESVVAGDAFADEANEDRFDPSDADVGASDPVDVDPGLKPAVVTVTETAESNAWMKRALSGSLVRGSGNDDVLDALAGRISALGVDTNALRSTMISAMEDFLGDAGQRDHEPNSTESELYQQIESTFSGSSAAHLCHSLFLAASADLAIEQAIMLARRFRPQRAYRTVALVGSDHGRSFLGRTASGRPELQEDLGPLVAGFSHVPAGEIDALKVAVDDQTACVLISPILWNRGGQVLEADYLRDVRRLCDDRDVLLAVDETDVVFGSAGNPLAITSIADVRPDIAILSSGLFGGLAGGITLASDRVVGAEPIVVDPYPLSSSVAAATLAMINEQGLISAVNSNAESLAVEIAERVRRFEFVRDIQVLGLSIGMETDLDSHSIVQAAAQRRLRLEAAGPNSIRMQPPLVVTKEDCELFADAIEATLSSIQLATADLSL